MKGPLIPSLSQGRSVSSHYLYKGFLRHFFLPDSHVVLAIKPYAPYTAQHDLHFEVSGPRHMDESFIVFPPTYGVFATDDNMYTFPALKGAGCVDESSAPSRPYTTPFLPHTTMRTSMWTNFWIRCADMGFSLSSFHP